MPWEVKKRGNQFCVVKKGTDETVHCHETEENAKAQVRALYANEKNLKAWTELMEVAKHSEL